MICHKTQPTDVTIHWSKGPVHQQITLLGLSFWSQHRPHLLLTSASTTRTSIIPLLRPNTSDSLTVYKYQATQLHQWSAQGIKTCSRSCRLSVAKNYLAAKSTLSTPHGLYTTAGTRHKFFMYHLLNKNLAFLPYSHAFVIFLPSPCHFLFINVCRSDICIGPVITFLKIF